MELNRQISFALENDVKSSLALNEENIELKKSDLEIFNTFAGDVVQQVEQISNAMNENAIAIQNITDASIVLRNNVNALESTTKQNNQDLKNVVNSIQETTKAFHAMEDIAKFIMQVANSISFCALNASIQAAQAGDAGKVFQIIADEIQKLSETTTAESKKIKKTIKNINEMIQQNLKKIESVTSNFVGTEKEIIADNEALQELTSSAIEAAASIEQVSKSAEILKNQASGLNEVFEDL